MKICKTTDNRDAIAITTSFITEVVVNIATLQEEIYAACEAGRDPAKLERVLHLYQEMYEVFLQHDGEGPEECRRFER